MKFDSVEYQIGSHFLSALINGDMSGLNSPEDKEIAEFEQSVVDQFGQGHWAPVDEESFFGWCDVSSVRGDVMTVLYMFPVEGPAK